MHDVWGSVRNEDARPLFKRQGKGFFLSLAFSQLVVVFFMCTLMSHSLRHGVTGWGVRTNPHPGGSPNQDLSPASVQVPAGGWGVGNTATDTNQGQGNGMGGPEPRKWGHASHQDLTKHKFKEKMIKSFKMVTTER